MTKTNLGLKNMRKLSFDTPDKALEFLLDGNKKFIEGKPEIKNYCFDSMLKSLDEGQIGRAHV